MGMLIPRTIPSGARVWMDSEVSDFVDRLRELDPRLALVQHSDKSWSIWRVAEDGSDHLIARSKPYAHLGPEVIEHLRQGNMQRRGPSPIDEMLKHNERVQREHEAKMDDTLADAWDKVMSRAYRQGKPE